jgi:hypothetical protein
VKDSQFFEFEEIIDIADYVVDEEFLTKYGKDIERRNEERKQIKKNAQLPKSSFWDSSFKFFPPINIPEKPNFLFGSSKKNSSEILRNRYSFLQDFCENSKHVSCNKSKILYKLHSVIVHSGFFFFFWFCSFYIL